MRRALLAVPLTISTMAAGAVLTPAGVAGGKPATPKPPPVAAEENVPSNGAAEVVFEREVTVAQMEAEERSGARPAAAAPDNFDYNLPQDAEAEQRRSDEANASAERQAAAAGGGETASTAAAPESDETAPPSTLTRAFWGIDQETGGCSPPDSDGAVGAKHYVEIVNCRVHIYRKTDNALVRNVALNTFFGDSSFIFDPRMVYDQTYKRYVGLATRRASSGTDTNRYFRLAVTNASNGDAAQNWLIYRVNFSGSDGEWCDYPQLGLGQDEILVTCNNFDDSPGGFSRTMVMGLSKARIYNGWGFSMPIFSPASTFAIAPPVLVGTPQQQDDRLYFTMADKAGDQVDLYRMNAASHPGQTTFVKQADINVGAWEQEFDAFNCGGGGPASAPTLVDALEGRFQQNGWQTNSSLWNVHSIAVDMDGNGSLDTIKPRFYEINTATNSITRSGIINTGGVGIDEFNASLMVNGANEMMAVWTRSSSTTTTCLQVMRGGCQVAAGECSGNIAGATINVNGAGPIRNIDGSGRNRWGDYSSIEPDPQAKSSTCGPNKTAWASIEGIAQNDARWDNRVLQFGFC